ncbi:diguanylate cyclase [Curvibacter sp. APW13]|uniref:GGDEF domain-containing protein n=1 Tax=Curvibacter sp. APW13 TaxID=3077236 RepID=UPI0028DEB3E3|nr:diguanylate cyclase [Curvibacter sp. APW13]MDT8989928.1 diguanylate cyclase [Curvibacter sp. APW13]
MRWVKGWEMPIAALLYWACARLGMALFALQPSNITLLWLPSGIGLVMVLHAGWRALPWIAVASFVANFSGMAHAAWQWQVVHTALAALVDMLTPWFAARQMQRHLPRGIQSTSDCLAFVLRVCVLPTVFSSLALAANLVIGGYIALAAAPDFVQMLLLADSLGILLVYPLYESMQRKGAGSALKKRNFAWGMALVLLFLFLAHTGLPQCIYLVIPVLLFMVFQSDTRYVSWALLMVIVVAVSAASLPQGPFGLFPQAARHQMLVAFLFSTTVTVLWGLYSSHELESEQHAARNWERIAGHDPLTGLVNRMVFAPMLAHEHERARRQSGDYRYAVAMLDLDYFKSVNDQHGHAVGDQVLVEVAQRMQAFLRGMDIAARYGGEEFSILFPGASAQEACLALERLRDDLEHNPVRIKGFHVGVTISAGVAEYAPHAGSADSLLAQADTALYQAKQAGRNRIVLAAI